MPAIAIKTLIATLFHAIATRPMIFWGLRIAAKLTTTKVDDNGVEIFVAMDAGDVERLQKAIKKLVEEWDLKL